MILLFALSFLGRGALALPSFEEVKNHDHSSEVVLLDRTGARIDSYRLNPSFRKSPWVGLKDISPLAREILIKVEDQRFLDHAGVDWISLVQSAMKSLAGERSRGASTLTMQLVSMIDPSQVHRGRRDFSQKFSQIKAALELEEKWTKDQILEAYLNLVPLRGELIGIHSAAQFLFQKDVGALDPIDASLIVALLPSPNQPWPKVAERACVFLKHFYETNPIQADSLCTGVAQRTIVLSENHNSLGAKKVAPHFVREWVKTRHLAQSKSGGVQKTSLDLSLQTHLQSWAKETLLTLHEQNVAEIAVVVFKSGSDEILGYLGNVADFSRSEEVDGVQAKRQAGSTLKPFLYGLALQDHKLDLDSTLLDEPYQVQTTNGAFRPDNYDHEFHGWVSVSVALASSLNIPAIKVAQMVGVDEFVAALKRIGIHDLKPGYIYGPSIALGTVDLSLYELTLAYSKLAKQALYQSSNSFPIDAINTQKIVRVLSDNASRALTFGLNSALNTPYFSAVKTGTSKDMRDNWCIGFSGDDTVGVWVGNFSGSPMQDVSGVSGAAPLWRRIMDSLHEKKQHSFPKAIQRIVLNQKSDEQLERSVTITKSIPKIVYPLDGALLAIDPEIPLERQKVWIKTSKPEGGDFSMSEWYINGEKAGLLRDPLLWSIRPGKFNIELKTAQGKVLDRSVFSVR